MRAAFRLILFISAMALAAVAFISINQVMTEERSYEQPTLSEGPEVTGVVVKGITNREANSIEIEVTGGDEPVPLSDTLITIKTEDGLSDLGVN